MFHVNLHEAQVKDAAFLCREQTGWLRMIAKFRLEGTSQGSSPTSCSMQGQRWDHSIIEYRMVRVRMVAQDFVHRGLENPWEQGQLSLSGQPALLPGCPHGERLYAEYSLVCSPNVSSFSLGLLSLLFPSLHYWEEPSWLYYPQLSLTGRCCGAAINPAVPSHGVIAPAPAILVVLHWVLCT